MLIGSEITLPKPTRALMELGNSTQTFKRGVLKVNVMPDLGLAGGVRFKILPDEECNV